MNAATNTTHTADTNTAGDELILIDGYGFLFRAYHSLPPLTRPSDKAPVGAIYGFSNMLMKLLGQHSGDYIAVALDAGKKTFRNDIYSEYKANRPPAPDDLIPQFPLVREAVEAFNLPVLEKEGYEADDLIATYTKRAVAQGLKVIIVSSDKDLMQLVSDNVTMFDPLKSREVKAPQVLEKFGVKPEQVLDVLALMGDSSDNIPGVPGIGPKTAAELINTYGDLDTLLAHASEIKQNKRRENLIAFAEQARLSKTLAALEENAPVDIAINALKLRESDSAKLATFLAFQGFKSLVNRINAGASFGKSASALPARGKKTHNFTSLSDIKALSAWLSKPKEIASLTLHLDSNKKGEIPGLGLALNKEQAAYIPLTEKETRPQDDLFTAPQDDTPSSAMHEALQVLKPWLEDDSVLKTFLNAKPLLRLCQTENITVHAVDDVMLLSYLLEGTGQKHTIIEMAERLLDEEIATVTDNSNEEERAKARSHEALCIAQLQPLLRQRLVEEKMVTLYERMEHPLVNVLAGMEHKGIKLDVSVLKQLSDDFAAKMENLAKEIYTLSGEEFNIGSPKQLGEILFDKMGIDGGKKSKKTGAYSTDASKLEELAASGHTIAEKVLSWRQCSKLKSTYTDALPKQLARDGRVHTHYAMTVTNTGRLSSNDPNLQNIPIRSEEGNKIRRAFIAEKGKKLISADYSQIELRLLAHMADIGTLKEAFANGQDIHATTASQVFGIPLENITSEYRRKAKAINFGIIYGMSAFGLAARLGISRTDAKHYIETYFKQYPGIRRYMDSSVEYAKEHGFITTLFGRKCFIREIQGKNPALRQFAERAAINAPLQGTAADIIKRAMVKLPAALKKANIAADMLLQVHDELIFEVDEVQSEAAASIIRREMENAARFSVPLTVEVGIGDNWAEIH